MKLVTSNDLKYRKFEEILSLMGVELVIKNLDLPEIQSVDMIDVVKVKAIKAYEITKEICLIDDMCLLMDAYPGFPGALTKLSIKLLGRDGLNKLLENKSKKAKMICYLAYFDGKEVQISKGQCTGILDFNRKVNEPMMPLSDWFISDNPMGHREEALNNLKNILFER